MIHGRSAALWAFLLLGFVLVSSQTGQFVSKTGEEPETIDDATAGSGRLAYIGQDGNVYVTSPGQTTPLALTSDATAGIEGQGLSYHRLSWSPDGRLAFASIDRALGKSESRLLVVDEPGGNTRLVGQSADHFVIYIYWSPAACPGRTTCSRLAYLIEEEMGIALRLVDIEGEMVDNRRIGLGGPVYFSWSPTGQQILWHTGGAGRFDGDARLVRSSIEERLDETLALTPGLFRAPAWSPQGEGWLGVAEGNGRDRLVYVRSDADQQVITKVEDRSVAFIWSPSGRKIAFAAAEDREGIVFRPVRVLDLDNPGKAVEVPNRFRVESFFWSPDGRRLAYLTRPSESGEFMQWRVYDLEKDEDRGYVMFRPTDQMRFVTNSFNQYAQSHRFWSPDGRYLVYADKNGDQIDRVWLTDTLAPRGARPILVAEGSIGFWSWH